jgi:hypothetical protein
MYVIKRTGEKQSVYFDKITKRIKRLINPVELSGDEFKYLETYKEEYNLDATLVAQKVVASLYPSITTEELDLESANICANMATKHPSYAYLAGRILVSNLHKKTLNKFTDKMELLYKNKVSIDPEWLEFILLNKDAINNIVDYKRDYIFDYFGFKTLEKSYLLKYHDHDKDIIIESPQDVLMRVASTLQRDLKLIKKTYDLMSFGNYTHASPTMYNCGTVKKQLSSCFLLGTQDSLD